MSSLKRMLGLLRLITPDSPTLDAESVSLALDCGVSTAYRYIRELASAGLLVRLPSGYALGPRVIQLDLQLRQTDPMLHHGRTLLQDLVRETNLSALLSELYDDMVISLHEEAGKGMDALSFGRGRAMPLHRGATGRIIMANLPPRRLRRVYDDLAGARSTADELPDWKQFSRQMAELRKKGYCLTRGEVETGLVGMAAPIFDEMRRVLGSLTLVGDAGRLEMFNEPFLGRLVCTAAATLTSRIESIPRTQRSAPTTKARKRA